MEEIIMGCRVNVIAPVFREKKFFSKEYRSIQEAINVCAADGGGIVTIPEGIFHTGPLQLASGVCLHMEKGCTIVFSGQKEEYLPPVFTRWEGIECENYRPLLYARNCRKIGITGEGTLIGNGSSWWDWKDRQGDGAQALYEDSVRNVPVSLRGLRTEKRFLRPQFIELIDCRDVLLADFTVKDGPQWTIHPVYCENCIIKGVHVETSGPNTDGLNPDSCQNMQIDDCDFCTGDDCIAINAGLNEDGWRVGIPCENIEVRNCRMRGGHGALTIGSAVSGGVRNIWMHDCRIAGTMQGIRVKSMRGRGGYVKDILFENIEMENVTGDGVQISQFYEFSTVMPKTLVPSAFENIRIQNVKGNCAGSAVNVKELSEQPIKGLELKNVTVCTA